ncbi:MAG TPA: carboxypeptidase regulatory-like domain-containing protein [Pyrinomonadaceae bacterium]|nr:carboxypeptidase regulatory-like domain-containing protein [Pyrinomonadaceae bacterium]
MNRTLFAVAILIACFTTSFSQTAQQKLVSLQGRVVDARTSEGIAKVRVIASGDQSTTTDENGEFTFEKLPVGELDLYITTVNYGLVKKTITLKDGDNRGVVIALNEDAAALTERVTVVAGPYDTAQTSVTTEQTLNKRELQSLSSILLGDPVRAAQALPGATTNDDFRSEFAVRGASFDRIGLYLDGILTENFVHTVQGGYADTGSLSVINSDTVDTLSLMSGAFPMKYGDRSGGILDIETRDGNRVKPAGRISASLSALSGVVDGPFANGRGSYLVAGRKSYVGYLVRRISDQEGFGNDPPILNFSDGHGKVLFDVTDRSQIGAALIVGAFDFDRNRDRNELGLNNVLHGESRNHLFNAHWNYTPNGQTFWQTRFFLIGTNFNNINRDDTTLVDGERRQYGVRSDLSLSRRSHRLETGLYIRSISVESFNQFFDFVSGTLRNAGSFDEDGTEQSYYVQDTWTSERLGLSLTGGGRLEHSSATGETLFSPRGSMVWSIDADWKVRAAAGRFNQFPDFELMFGRLGNPNLKSESSTHYTASVERRFGDRMRLLVEVYDREDEELFFSLSEPRMVGNVPTFTEFPFQNSLHGHARGIELTLQRRSANKFSGWVSYAYSRTKLTDELTGLTFVSDTDQRHTVNVYGSYRFNETWNFSSAWRYGSGQPVPGFYRQVGTGYFLTNVRNTTRLPSYNRLDLRVNKAFLFEKWKLTLNGEVINVTNSNNRRYAGFDGFGFDGRVFGQLDRVLPILPSAGVVIEF